MQWASQLSFQSLLEELPKINVRTSEERTRIAHWGPMRRLSGCITGILIPTQIKQSDSRCQSFLPCRCHRPSVPWDCHRAKSHSTLSLQIGNQRQWPCCHYRYYVSEIDVSLHTGRTQSNPQRSQHQGHRVVATHTPLWHPPQKLPARSRRRNPQAHPSWS
jgi:hypothetical protein